MQEKKLIDKTIKAYKEKMLKLAEARNKARAEAKTAGALK